MDVINLINQKFGKLTVSSRQFSDKYRNACWLCRCDCGNQKIVRGYDLKSGAVKSCGCLVKKHGMFGTRIYQTWWSMLQRCRDKNHKAYKNYGGRGITVCKKWLDFKNFYNDVGDRPSKNLTLERIDNNKGYLPENVKWATMKEQSNNSRINVKISYQNQELTIAQWADKVGINYSCLRQRLRKLNWPIEKALTQPVR